MSRHGATLLTPSRRMNNNYWVTNSHGVDDKIIMKSNWTTNSKGFLRSESTSREEVIAIVTEEADVDKGRVDALVREVMPSRSNVKSGKEEKFVYDMKSLAQHEIPPKSISLLRILFKEDLDSLSKNECSVIRHAPDFIEVNGFRSSTTLESKESVEQVKMIIKKDFSEYMNNTFSFDGRGKATFQGRSRGGGGGQSGAMYGTATPTIDNIQIHDRKLDSGEVKEEFKKALESNFMNNG